MCGHVISLGPEMGDFVVERITHALSYLQAARERKGSSPYGWDKCFRKGGR
jgi:hypothetical protein